jgi:hypothetical protein
VRLSVATETLKEAMKSNYGWIIRTHFLIFLYLYRFFVLYESRQWSINAVMWKHCEAVNFIYDISWQCARSEGFLITSKPLNKDIFKIK